MESAGFSRESFLEDDLASRLPCELAICGGRAAEAFVGRTLREHTDWDPAIICDDFAEALDGLAGAGLVPLEHDYERTHVGDPWLLRAADPARVREIMAGDPKDRAVWLSDLWLAPAALLEELDGRDLVFGDLLDAGLIADVKFIQTDGSAAWFGDWPNELMDLEQATILRDGVRYLAPVPVLARKAHEAHKPKAVADFLAAAPLLSKEEREQLMGILRKHFPGGHPWYDLLQKLA